MGDNFIHIIGDSLPCFVGNSAALESDLQRVQQKVGDLQRQRQELSMQVRQLTDRSNSLQQQIKPMSGSSLNNQGTFWYTLGDILSPC